MYLKEQEHVFELYNVIFLENTSHNPALMV